MVTLAGTMMSNNVLLVDLVIVYSDSMETCLSSFIEQ